MDSQQHHTNSDLYTTLKESEIRLLKLHPGALGEELQADLEVVPLETNPRYKAISYVWDPAEGSKGEVVKSETLILAQRRVGITPSLRDALQRFRHVDCTVSLWADAVCIDQSDILERAAQVNLMAMVYEQADTVLVWLGEFTPRDAIAFWMIALLAKLRPFYPEVSMRKRTASRPRDIVHYQLLPSMFEEAISGSRPLMCPCCGTTFNMSAQSSPGKLVEGLRVLGELFGSPWFGRLWVVQENAVAQNSSFYLGNHSTSWDDLQIAIRVGQDWISRSSYLKYFTATDQARYCRASRLEELVTQFHIHKSDSSLGSTTSTLLDVMINASHLKSHWTHDRLYSIRAVAFIEHEAEFKPDYGLLIEKLWQRVVRYLVKTESTWNTHSYDFGVCQSIVLTIAGLQNRHGKRPLPSWIPDMAAIDDEEIHRKYQFCMANSRRNCAGGTGRFWVNIETSPKILYVRGVCFSVVKEILPGSQYRPSAYEEEKMVEKHDSSKSYWAEMENRLVPWYLKCFDFVFDCAPAKARINPETLDFSTLMAHGCRYNSLEVRASTTRDPRMNNGRLKLFRLLIDAHDPDHTLSATLTPQRILDDMFMYVNFGQTQHDIDSTRVLAHTSDDRVGWIPQHAQVGDVVCLLEGAPEPYVIRAAGEGLYTVVGDAYIHGVMQGEQWCDDRDMSDMVFGLV